MAERRMFTKKITESDAFLDLPMSAQNLYFHLNMYADDRGFIANPRSVMRLCRCSDDDAKVLLSKKFIISFENGVFLIKHWKMHNFIAKDRFNESAYLELMSCLFYDENKAYTFNETDSPVLPNAVLTPCQQPVNEPVYTPYTQDRLGKESIDKDSLVEGSNYSVNPDTPTLSDIKIFIQNNGLTVNAEKFFHHYNGQNWLYKGQPMDWRSKLREWAAEDASKPAPKGMKTMPMANYSSADIDLDALRANLERI